MRHTILTLALLLLPLLGNAQDILGNWYVEDRSGIVEIYQEGQVVKGKIVWMKTSRDAEGHLLTDENNKDKAKRKRPLLGMPLIDGMTREKDGWDNGTVYDPDTGRAYDCIIKQIDGKLHVRGHVGPFGKTLVWTRATDQLPVQK